MEEDAETIRLAPKLRQQPLAHFKVKVRTRYPLRHNEGITRLGTTKAVQMAKPGTLEVRRKYFSRYLS